MNNEAVIFRKLAAVKMKEYTQGLQELLVIGVRVSPLEILLRWRILPHDLLPGLEIHELHSHQFVTKNARKARLTI